MVFNNPDNGPEATHELLARVHAALGPFFDQEKVERQVSQYLAQGMTTSDLSDCVTYWYDVLGNDPKKSNGGIGIFPYVVNRVRKWRKERDSVADGIRPQEFEIYDRMLHDLPESKAPRDMTRERWVME